MTDQAQPHTADAAVVVEPPPTPAEAAAITAAVGALVVGAPAAAPVVAAAPADAGAAPALPPLPPLPIVLTTGGRVYTPAPDEGAAVVAAIVSYLAHAEAAADATAAEAAAAEAAAADAAAPTPTPTPTSEPALPLIMLTNGQLYTPDDDEGVAVFAAITAYLAEEDARHEQPTEVGMAGWQQARLLLIQNITTQRVPHPPRWHTVERLRRAGAGQPGIVGL